MALSSPPTSPGLSPELSLAVFEPRTSESTGTAIVFGSYMDGDINSPLVHPGQSLSGS